jgi:hypothetical protein
VPVLCPQLNKISSPLLLVRQGEGHVARRGAEYLLNSIESLIVNDSEVSLRGVCSRSVDVP